MRPFDSKEEAYHAGMADGYNDGYNQGSDQGEQQRHELEVEIIRLKQKILDLTGECECGCEQYSLCHDTGHDKKAIRRVLQNA